MSDWSEPYVEVQREVARAERLLALWKWEEAWACLVRAGEAIERLKESVRAHQVGGRK